MATNKIRKHDVDLSASDVGALPIIDANSANYDMDVVIKDKSLNGLVYKTGSTTLGTPYAKGITGLADALILNISSSVNYGAQFAFVSGGQGSNPMYWRTLRGGEISNWSTGFLPLVGGTLIGAELFFNNGLGRIASGSTAIQIETRNDVGDTNNRRFISLNNPSGKSEFGDSLILSQIVNGTQRSVKLYGEHNKPSGSYTGNGDATSRTINTGGLGHALIVYSTSGFNCLVTYYGAWCFNTTSQIALGYTNVHFRNGDLTLMTTETALNRNGTTYFYQVL